MHPVKNRLAAVPCISAEKLLPQFMLHMCRLQLTMYQF